MKLSEIVSKIIESFESGKTLCIEHGETPFDTQKIELKPFDIISVSIVESEKSIAQQIRESDNLETALMLTKNGHITKEEEIALDELKERLMPIKTTERFARLRESISREIALRGSKMPVESVLKFLWQNILGLSETPSSLDSMQIERLITNVPNAVKKLGEVDF